MNGTKTALTVALRKESVDRNGYSAVNLSHVNQSLSARRAWIEMQRLCASPRRGVVALRKESVDRNMDGYGGTKGL